MDYNTARVVEGEVEIVVTLVVEGEVDIVVD